MNRNLEGFLKRNGKNIRRHKRELLKENVPPSFYLDYASDFADSRDDAYPPIPEHGDISDRNNDADDPIKRSVVMAISVGDKIPINHNTGQSYSNFHDLVNYYLKEVFGEDKASLKEICDVLKEKFGDNKNEEDTSKSLDLLSREYETSMMNKEENPFKVDSFNDDDYWQ